MASANRTRLAKRASRLRGHFKSIAYLWLEHWREGTKSGAVAPNHGGVWQKRRVLPVPLGARPLTEIEAPELVAMAKAIEQRGAREIAERALQTVSQVFRFALAHGYSHRNPASDFKPSDILKSARTTNYARIDAKALPELLRAIEVYQGTHITRLAIKLMALTFVRTGELIEAADGQSSTSKAHAGKFPPTA